MAGGTRVGGRCPPSHWIIANGFWSDSGLWFDQSAWATRTAVEDQVLAADVREGLNYTLGLTTGATISNLEGGSSVRTKINALLAATTGATAIANGENEVTVLAKIDAALAFVLDVEGVTELTIAEGDTDDVPFTSPLIAPTWSVFDDAGTGATIHPTTGVLSIPAQTYYVDARYQPNSPDSFYNIPLGDGATYADTSAPQTRAVRDVQLESPGFYRAYTWLEGNSFPVYFCDGTEETVRVYYTARTDDTVPAQSGGIIEAFPWDDRPGAGQPHAGDYLDQYFEMPLPNGPDWLTNPGLYTTKADHWLTVVHQDGVHYWDLIAVSPSANPLAGYTAGTYPAGHWFAYFAAYRRLDDPGWTSWGIDYPAHIGGRAPGFPTLPGAIRAHEVEAAEIPHGLAMAGSQKQERYAPSGALTDKPDQVVWPVPYPDGNSHTNWDGGDPGSATSADLYFRQGDLFALPQTIDVYALGLQTPLGFAIAKAYQNFGGYIVDTATDTFTLAHLENTDDDFDTGVNTNVWADIAIIRANLCYVENNIERVWPGTNGVLSFDGDYWIGGQTTGSFGGPGARVIPAPKVAPFGNHNPAQIVVRATQGATTVDQTLTLTVTEVDTVAPTPRTATSWSWMERHPLSIRLRAHKPFVPTIVGGAQQADFAISSWADEFSGKTEYRLHWAADATKTIDGSDTYAVIVRYTNASALAYTDQTITVTVDQTSADGNCITEGAFSTADLSRWSAASLEIGAASGMSVASGTLQLATAAGQNYPVAKRVVYLIPEHRYRLEVGSIAVVGSLEPLTRVQPGQIVNHIVPVPLNTVFVATNVEHILELTNLNWQSEDLVTTARWDDISLIDITVNVEPPPTPAGPNLIVNPDFASTTLTGWNSEAYLPDYSLIDTSAVCISVVDGKMRIATPVGRVSPAAFYYVGNLAAGTYRFFATISAGSTGSSVQMRVGYDDTNANGTAIWAGSVLSAAAAPLYPETDLVWAGGDCYLTFETLGATVDIDDVYAGLVT
jgi:hypothetical protein